MKNFLWGAFGGMTPVIATLIVTDFYPFPEYVILDDPGGEALKKVVIYLLLTIALLVLGGVWSYLNSATDALKAFQLGIAAPAVVIGTLSAKDARDAKENDPELKVSSLKDITELDYSSVSWALYFKKPLPELQNSILLAQFGNLSDQATIEDLPKLFGGVERRLASDRLISLYPENKERVVDAVINAIQEDSLKTSYRINIYVARTLRLIVGGWEGTQEDLSRIKSLRMQNNYKDVNFKENVDGAVKNWVVAKSLNT